MDVKPFYNAFSPLGFRGIPDVLAKSSSECCLIHADNPLSRTKGVWLNSKVRVGYNGPAYDAVHGRCGGLSPFEVFCGLWKNQLLRWFTTTWVKSYVVQRRVHAWETNSSDVNREPARFCLIDEMQVLAARSMRCKF